MLTFIYENNILRVQTKQNYFQIEYEQITYR